MNTELSKSEEPVSVFTPLQDFVRRNYCYGDMAHVTPDTLADCGDGLFTFCINEAHDSGGDRVEFSRMLTRARAQLSALRDAVDESYLRGEKK